MKKITSLLLVLLLTLSMAVPAFAASFDTLIKLEDKSSTNAYFDSFKTVYDASTGSSQTFSYSVPTDGATVLIFYSTDSSDVGSVNLFSELTNASWAKSDKLNFIAVEINKGTKSAVNSYLAKNDKNGVVSKSYYNSSSDYNLLLWYYTYVEKSGTPDGSFSMSTGLSFVVIINQVSGKNYIRYALKGVTSASTISSSLSKIIDTSSLVGGYDGYLDSGSLALDKLSKLEIADILENAPQLIPDTDDGYFSVAPSVTSPYSTGTVKTTYLQAATDRLSALRRIAGLPGVTMDTSLNKNAQYGAVLLAASDFSHYPVNPGDMDDSFFKTGTEATASSNIAAGRHLTVTPDGFMEDKGTNNLPVMGHRRWQLNPKLLKVGFGIAVNYNNPNYGNSYKYYADEKCHDASGDGFDYRFIAWPASGNFPTSLFGKDTAWSVTLSPAYYQTPNINNVTVSVTRSSDSQNWTFSNSESYAIADSGKYFTVETNAYAVANCIIFRPDGITEYDGEYTVVISGLKDSFGGNVSLSYKVNFFNADTVEDLSHWETVGNVKYYYNEDGDLVKGLHTIKGNKYYFDPTTGAMQTGWQKISKEWYYFGIDGIMRTLWQKIDGKWYYFDPTTGAMQTGIVVIDGKKFFFDPDTGAMKTGLVVDEMTLDEYYFDSETGAVTGLVTIDGQKYYFGDDGVRVFSSWVDVDGKRFFIDDNGVFVTKWYDDGNNNVYYIDSENGVVTGLKTIDGKKYYFGTDGAMATKWQKIGGKWYYFGTDGIMVTGWQKIGGKAYYFGTDGIMRTLWKKIGGKAYYFGTDGIMRTLWQKIDGKKYYFGTDGAMATKWQKIGGKWYYFGTDGIMVTGWQKISKKWYYFGTDGIMATKWQKISKKWYYFGTDGAMVTKWQKINKKWYYFGTDGIMVTKWQKISKKWYYFGSDGIMVTKWQKIGGKWYYFGTDGIMVANCSKKIGKKTYKFDKNGVCLNP